MIISHKHKFIFVHPPKVAGTSIINSLVNANCLTWEDVPNGNNHQTYRELEIKLGSLEKYFVFSFVRNPYERILSFYFYLKETGIPKKLKQNMPISENLEVARQSSSFKTAIKNKFMVKSFMWYFLDNQNKINLDFIGRFENLQEDFNTICDKIGIHQREIPHKNKTKHKNYTEYYDEETRNIVAERYARDIEYFGYEFGE